jgi:preprotein translocase subunit SecG
MLLGLLLVIQIIVCIALTAVILLQRSEGGALGMGGGPSGFMTARGAGDLLTRTTSILGAVFFVLSMILTIISGHGRGGSSVVDRLKVDALNPDALNTAPQPAPAQGAEPAPVPVAPGAVPAQPAAPSVFEAPRPQVNTAPSVAPTAPPTTTGDSGARSPASQVLGVQTAPQAPQPAPKQ